MNKRYSYVILIIGLISAIGVFLHYDTNFLQYVIEYVYGTFDELSSAKQTVELMSDSKTAPAGEYYLFILFSCGIISIVNLIHNRVLYKEEHYKVDKYMCNLSKALYAFVLSHFLSLIYYYRIESKGYFFNRDFLNQALQTTGQFRALIIILSLIIFYICAIMLFIIVVASTPTLAKLFIIVLLYNYMNDFLPNEVNFSIIYIALSFLLGKASVLLCCIVIKFSLLGLPHLSFLKKWIGYLE